MSIIFGPENVETLCVDAAISEPEEEHLGENLRRHLEGNAVAYMAREITKRARFHKFVPTSFEREAFGKFTTLRWEIEVVTPLSKFEDYLTMQRRKAYGEAALIVEQYTGDKFLAERIRKMSE